MWDVAGKIVPPEQFAPFEPITELMFNDGPTIFTFLAESKLAYAHWCDDGAGLMRFFVKRNITPEQLKDIEEGNRAIRDYLEEGALFVVDVENCTGLPVRAWETAAKDVPSGYLPLPGARLRPARSNVAPR